MCKFNKKLILASELFVVELLLKYIHSSALLRKASTFHSIMKALINGNNLDLAQSVKDLRLEQVLTANHVSNGKNTMVFFSLEQLANSACCR